MKELAGSEGDLTRELATSKDVELRDMAEGFNAFTAQTQSDDFSAETIQWRAAATMSATGWFE